MKFNEDIIIMGGVILLVFILLIIFIIFFLIVFQRNRQLNLKEKQQLRSNFERELLKTQLEAKEDTFNLIAEELHDNIGQLLSSTRMLIGITKRNLGQSPDTLKTADETLGQAIQDLRSLSKSLSKEWLSQFDLYENLQTETDRIKLSRATQIELSMPDEPLPLESDIRVMLFRVIQEAIQNAIKHGKPEHLAIRLEIEAEILVLIQDDGRGFDAERLEGNGIGIMNMRRRTAFLGGDISWNSNPVSGTTVRITIPLKINQQ